MNLIKRLFRREKSEEGSNVSSETEAAFDKVLCEPSDVKVSVPGANAWERYCAEKKNAKNN